MGYQVGPGDPVWSLNIAEFEKKAANYFKTNNVTNDAQRATFVAAMSAAQQTAAIKAFFDCFHATT